MHLLAPVIHRNNVREPAEKRSPEATYSQNRDLDNLRCILKIARTEFCPRHAKRGSEWAENITVQENLERIRDFLKKIGSNFCIAERTLSFPLKNAWILAGKYHAEARSAEATSSQNWDLDKMR